MNRVIIYIHGKGGSAAEAEHYRPLFPDCRVLGLEYSAETPRQAREELPRKLRQLAGNTPVTLIANSIGAYFSLCALSEENIEQAFLISPVVDMERLIVTMMGWAGIDEAELRRRGRVETAFGETLDWEYLRDVRSHPVQWRIPTHILYAGGDNLTDRETITAFARRVGATLTVMEDGEHWFHTPEQLDFLDDWLRERTKGDADE